MPDFNGDNNNRLITALKDNPPESWHCCLKHAGIKTNILSFLERIFKDTSLQNKYVSKGVIRTDIKAKNKKMKYNIIFKQDKHSTAIIPMWLYPMPCENKVCKHNHNYNQNIGQ